MLFEELNLPDFILEGLKNQDFSLATDIQAKCIPAIREGRDVVGTSQTGSGKTYAFGIPAIEMIDPDPYVQVLIVCPTRELAGQVCDELRKLTSLKEGTRVVPIFGGSSIERQIMALKKSARIVVGTPGRLNDHIRRKTLKLQRVKMLVLDEADEMLDMGFREDIEEILKVTNPERQTVMFSATMPKPILEITKHYMREPLQIEGDTQGEAQSFIEQFYVSVERNNKNSALLMLLTTLNPERSIVFCNTRSMVDTITEYLNDNNVAAIGIHGEMRQNERRASMQAIKQNLSRVLVATDVAARGIDIKDVEMIINYDIPNCSEYYVHRIGRTARAGKKGAAYTIVNGKGQMQDLDQIKRDTKNDIEEYKCDLSVKFDSKSAKRSDAPRKDVFKKGKNYVSSSKKKFDSKPDFYADKPKTDWKSDKPKTDWKSDKPKTDWKSDKPKTDWKSDKPKTDWKSDKPKTDWKSDKPKTDWKSDKPRSEGAKKGASTRIWNQDKPKTDWKSDKPKTDWKSDKPKTEWKSDKPKTDWKSDKPKGDWKSDKPKTDWKSDKPKTDWKSDKPRSEGAKKGASTRIWNQDKPKTDWKSDKPKTDWKSEKPKTDWKSDKPKTDWKSDKPKTDWKSDKPKTDWKSDKPKTDWKSDKPKTDWKSRPADGASKKHYPKPNRPTK